MTPRVAWCVASCAAQCVASCAAQCVAQGVAQCIACIACCIASCIARWRVVFGAPGGPCSSTPLGGAMPRRWYASAWSSGHSTARRSLRLTSSSPPISLHGSGSIAPPCVPACCRPTAAPISRSAARQSAAHTLTPPTGARPPLRGGASGPASERGSAPPGGAEAGAARRTPCIAASRARASRSAAA